MKFNRNHSIELITPPSKKYGPSTLSSRMDTIRFSQQMNFILEIDNLKQVLRETHLADGTRRENVAEHSWHLAIMALLLEEYANHRELNLLRILKMLLLHDLVEIDAGDTFFYDKDRAKDQLQREEQAAKRIFGLLPKNQQEEFVQLWKEFESMTTPEAQFARAIDFLHPVLLAVRNGGISWKNNKVTKPQVLEAKQPMSLGSSKLWEYTKDLINEAVAKGILEEEATKEFHHLID